MIDFSARDMEPSNEKKIHYSRELIKVIDFLNETKQDFQIEELYNGWALIVPNHDDYKFDVICNDASYGHARGLLETMGAIVDGEYGNVEGFLTGEQVIDRIKEFYLHETTGENNNGVHTKNN